jgi:hypothetical protein
MTDDLKELDERIAYSSRQIDELQTEVLSYLTGAFQTRAWKPFVVGTVYAQARVRSSVPTEIKVKVGTITNELRSILDALACALAIRNGQTDKGVYFPIRETKAFFETDGMKLIKSFHLRTSKALPT